MVWLCFIAIPVSAAEILIASASNFIQPLTVLAEQFEKETGHQVNLAFGSSGKLYAQIRYGAPFDVFLSADKDKVMRLLSDGKAVHDSEFIYATGRLVLWSSQANKVDEAGYVLQHGKFERLAIANPKLAPYGEAGMAVLHALGLNKALISKQIMGDSIAQTFQFVHSGNAELGFVALSQVIGLKSQSQGSYWIIPDEYYQPIAQYAVLLHVKKSTRRTVIYVFFKA